MAKRRRCSQHVRVWWPGSPDLVCDECGHQKRIRPSHRERRGGAPSRLDKIRERSAREAFHLIDSILESVGIEDEVVDEETLREAAKLAECSGSAVADEVVGVLLDGGFKTKDLKADGVFGNEARASLFRVFSAHLGKVFEP